MNHARSKIQTLTNKRSPDAAESSAGDDFHILWTISKSLELLNFKKDGLKSIAIEGLAPGDRIEGDILLGVDLTEYYGGVDFQSATSVIISQLKYSTRRSNLEWTSSRISTGKTGKINGSIINRLGVLFKGIIAKNGRDAVLEKLIIKLVSNRRASGDLLNAVSQAKLILNKNKKGVTLPTLKKGLNKKWILEINKMAKASKLTGELFTDFLRVLDFSDCDTSSRFSRKQTLLKQISNLGSFEAKKEYEQLHGLVWSKMMPESAHNNTLLKEDILYLFGFSDLSDLLPVRSKIESVKKIIVREQFPEILNLINDNTNTLICLHGNAGIGKSTITELISAKLLHDSIAIVFDCYGGGAYLDPEDKRHKHENAFLQLCNELALKIGTPFLLVRNATSDFYIREFKKRLELAAKALTTINQAAIIVIIIDAADNSITAAQRYQNDCFVNDLVNISLPERCKIVITARSERLLLLNLPSQHSQLKITPFSFQETRVFLNDHFPSLKVSEAEAFRRLTKGNPRVMSYALGGPGKKISDKIKPLKPDGKTLDDIFTLRINEADKRAGDKKIIAIILTYLISLPRPVPIKYLQRLTKISEQTIEDVSIDLWHGLVYENNNFSFRDEDFENFIRNRYIPRSIELNSLADVFLENGDVDDYASVHLGTALFNSGKKQELRDIVLERKHLAYPQDPVRNREVFVERTRLAMRLCSSDENNFNFLKLQMVAAEASKTNKVLEEILLNNAELAAEYGNLQTNQKLYFQSGNPEWFGPVHFRNAAIFSRKKESQSIAKDHLEKARNWLSFRERLDKHKREEYKITTSDIAYGAEAVLRLSDANNCIRWIASWRPKSFIYEVVEQLTTNLISTSSYRQLKKWFDGKNFRTDIQFLIIKIFFEHGIKPPIEITDLVKHAENLKRLKGKIDLKLSESIISFCEYSLMAGREFYEIKSILDEITVKLPERVPSFYDGYDFGSDRVNMDINFRKAALYSVEEKTELKVEQFYPDHLEKAIKSDKYEIKQSAEEERRKFHTLYKHFLPVYRLRVNYFLKVASKKELNAQLTVILKNIEKDWEFRYRREHEIKYILKFFANKILDVVFYSDGNKISLILKSLLLDNRQNITLRLSLANRLSYTKRFENHVLNLLTEVEQEIEESYLSGGEILDHYTKATIIANRLSSVMGKKYFDKMVLSSNEIDLEAHEQIKCINAIVPENKNLTLPKLAFEFARFIEYCYERLSGWDHFPWEQGIRALIKLDIASAYAIVCRWDHRNVRNINEHFVELLQESLRQEYIDHLTVSALLSINKYYWHGINELSGEIVKRFDIVGNSYWKNIFLQEFCRDIKIHFSPTTSARFVGDFFELIKEGRYLDISIANEFEEYYNKLIAVTGFKEQKEGRTGKLRIAKDVLATYKKTLSDINPIQTIEIEGIFLKLRKENANSFVDEELIFDMLRKKVRSNQHIEHLDAISKINSKIVSFWAFEYAISSALKDWSIYPEIQEWKHVSFKRIILDKFEHFISYDHLHLTDLKKWAGLFGLSDIELSNFILSILPDYLNELSSTILYQLFEITLVQTTIDEREMLVEWSLNRWNEKIKPDFGDEVFTNDFLPPIDANLVIARFIRFTLGHPDKRLRWGAAHCLRRLAKFNKTEIVEFLLKEQNEITNFQFQNSSYLFFSLSAKLFLWIGLERIAKENPEYLTHFIPYIQNEILSTNISHAQIKHFIKSTSLALINLNSDIFENDVEMAIKSLLISQLKARKVKNRFESRKNLSRKRKYRFDYDTMDTLPYWYEPLARVFGISSEDVAITADKFIIEKWGYTGNARKENHVRENDYYLTSNDHGSEPVVEDLRIYYEYHAMQCAACELLATVPLIKTDSWYESWESWLSRWTPRWDNFWMSDFRDPIPFVKKLWTDKRTKENWEWNINLYDFDETTLIKTSAGNDYLVIYLDQTIHYGEDYENSNVMSALVNPPTAFALLRALQTAERYDYHIPFENDKEDETQSLREKFQMQGWIKNISKESSGIDKIDELCNDIPNNRIIVGTEFCNWAKINHSKDFRFSFQKNDPKTKITTLETWSDGNRNPRYGDFTSNGSRLLLRKKFLLPFLQSINRSLIIGCEISRFPKVKGFNDRISYYTHFYIIYPDGKVKTISRDFRIR